MLPDGSLPSDRLTLTGWDGLDAAARVEVAQAVAARLPEVGARADGVQGVTGLGAQVLCRRELGGLNDGHDDATFS